MKLQALRESAFERGPAPDNSAAPREDPENVDKMEPRRASTVGGKDGVMRARNCMTLPLSRPSLCYRFISRTFQSLARIVKNLRRFFEGFFKSRAVTQSLDDLDINKRMFTLPIRTKPARRSEYQAIQHYWNCANGDMNEWIAAADSLNQCSLTIIADMLRQIRGQKVTNPAVLAKLRWFVEAILQPDESFTSNLAGVKSALKLVKIRKLAVHPDKFQTQASEADKDCFINARALLNLLESVQELLQDAELSLLIIGSTTNS